MAKRFGFPKAEKLKSRKLIEELFTTGKSFAAFPIRTIYMFASTTAEPGILTGVTVNKRNFKRAVDRNKIKRLLREAYRLQKIALLDDAKRNNKKGYIFFMYTDKKICDFNIIYEAMSKSLRTLQKKISEADAENS